VSDPQKGRIAGAGKGSELREGTLIGSVVMVGYPEPDIQEEL
jgi:hypothetical protein